MARHDSAVVVFDEAADEYDAARPSYPTGLYDLLESLIGPLAGRTAVDAGAGTGVATRQLAERGAAVTALDAGVEMLRRAVARTPDLRALVADAGVLPVRASSLDLVSFAQSWHWLRHAEAAAEMARVLRPGAWWAAWWNHPWADGEGWFEDYQGLLERSCPGYSRHQRDVDWTAEAIARHGAFSPPRRHVVPWTRSASVEAWITDLASHSYVIALPAEERQGLLAASARILRAEFGDRMTVPYQTRLWLAQKA